MEIFINNKSQFIIHFSLKCTELKQRIEKELNLASDEYYMVTDGKRIDDHDVIKDGRIHIIPKVLGGKGGFGSMLRAVGAQIKKTTNKEACRDLSGRRIRDVNEEQRLNNWVNQQAEREKEAKEIKKKKLERLCEKPRHEFKDEQYDKDRSELAEKVEDALLQGLQASCCSKRKAADKRVVVKSKKLKLWIDDELDEDLSCPSDDDGDSGSEEASGSSEISQHSKVSREYIALKNDVIEDSSTSKVNLEISILMKSRSESEDEKN